MQDILCFQYLNLGYVQLGQKPEYENKWITQKNLAD